jgi:hypothetical protein
LNQLDKIRSVEFEGNWMRITVGVVRVVVLSLEHGMIEVFLLGAVVREQIERLRVVNNAAVVALDQSDACSSEYNSLMRSPNYG